MKSKKKKKSLISKKNKAEIFWNLVNCTLAFLISFLSSLVAFLSIDGFTFQEFLISFGIAFITGLLTFVIKFNDFWNKEKKDYCKEKKKIQYQILNFI